MTARPRAATWVGRVALAASVGASVWLASAAASDRYLVELPTGLDTSWVDGPLRGLGASLGPSGFSAAMITLAAAYLLALGCARSISLRFAFGSIVLANLAFTLGPTVVSSDVFGYIAYAREAAHGLNPYVSPPISLPHDAILHYVYWKHQTSPYGPLFTILSVPLGPVTAGAALWTYKALAGLASVAIAFLVADIARARGMNPSRAAIFVGLNPVLLVFAVSGAHNDLLAALLVGVAIALVLRGRESAGGGAAVAAAAIKLTLGLALPFVVIAARRRGAAVRGATLAVIAIGVPTVLLAGPHFLDQLRRIASDHQFDIAFSGPDRLGHVLGGGIDTFVRTLCTGGAVIVALVMIVRAWRGGDAVSAAGWAFLALAVSIASLAPWYLVWLLPLAAVGGSRALGGAALLATLYLLAVHLPALGGQPWLTPAGGAAGRTEQVRLSSAVARSSRDRRGKKLTYRLRNPPGF